MSCATSRSFDAPHRECSLCRPVSVEDSAFVSNYLAARETRPNYGTGVFSVKAVESSQLEVNGPVRAASLKQPAGRPGRLKIALDGLKRPPGLM